MSLRVELHATAWASAFGVNACSCDQTPFRVRHRCGGSPGEEGLFAYVRNTSSGTSLLGSFFPGVGFRGSADHLCHIRVEIVENMSFRVSFGLESSCDFAEHGAPRSEQAWSQPGVELQCSNIVGESIVGRCR